MLLPKPGTCDMGFFKGNPDCACSFGNTFFYTNFVEADGNG